MSDLLVSSTAPRPLDYLDSRPRPEHQGLASTLDAESKFSGGGAVESMDDGVVSADDVEGLPLALVRAYVDIAVSHAAVREVDSGVLLATVAGLEGAWGDGADEAEALQELREAIVGWVAVKRRLGATDIPLMEGIDLNPRA